MNTLLSLSGTVLEMIPRTDRFSFGIGPDLDRQKQHHTSQAIHHAREKRKGGKAQRGGGGEGRGDGDGEAREAETVSKLAYA